MGSVRTRVLETIRSYAAEHLAESGKATDVAIRHMTHMLDRARSSNEHLRSADELDGHLALRRDWPDIRRAMTTAIALDNGAAACALINDVLIWAVTRNQTEVGPWCEAILQMSSVTDLPAKIPAIAGAMRFAHLGGGTERAAAAARAWTLGGGSTRSVRRADPPSLRRVRSPP